MIRLFTIGASLLSCITLFSHNLHANDPTQNNDKQFKSVVGESREQYDQRMQWWSDSRFGVFIHWGLYAIPAGEWNGETVPRYGEWIMRHGKIALKDYTPLIDQFNPTKFDAKQWMTVIKNSGAKYFVITTKHHEGFSLFRSEHGDYNIANTPFGRDNDRDIMTELADEARKQSIKVGWYHSILDWHHPDFAPQKGFLKHENKNPDFEKYIEYLTNQTTELLTNYGDIDILWYDGEWDSTWTDDHGNTLYKHIRELAPNIIVNNRVGKERSKEKFELSKKRKKRRANKQTKQAEPQPNKSFGEISSGDFGTPEQKLPPNGFGPGIYWETCMTMNNTWGYRTDDHDWKSSTTLIQQLIDASSKGGNYLLNIGPKADGTIPQESIDRLNDIGNWLSINGEAIYATKAGTLGKPAWGRSTTKSLANGNTALYLHLFNNPKDNQLILEGYADKLISLIPLTANDASAVNLTYTTSDNNLVIETPATLWNQHASVIKIELKELP
ncbi:alpha-L-fucosidase [Poriferisphaera sp. WC338]|uniref:alpha-L-fucosidase n=1 Tax=Poriferisphaera sp. WC338 TaxID=3425129 RepID=UPI003D81BAFC